MRLKKIFNKLLGDNEPPAPATAQKDAVSPYRGTIEHTRFFARAAEACSFYDDVHLTIVYNKSENTLKFRVYSFDFMISFFKHLANHGFSERDSNYLKSLNTNIKHLDAVHVIHCTDDSDFNVSYYAEQVRKFNPSATLRILPDGIFADTREK